jgi:hypothetical protein
MALAVLVGLQQLVQGKRAGHVFSLLLAASGVFAFSVHTWPGIRFTSVEARVGGGPDRFLGADRVAQTLVSAAPRLISALGMRHRNSEREHLAR